MLVAQRVLARDGVTKAVNTFRYEEPEGAVWPTDLHLAFDWPWVLASGTIRVQPGGNRVLSYLDLAFPDNADPDDIYGGIAEYLLLSFPPSTPVPFPWRGCVINFGSGMEKDWTDEFLDLVMAALDEHKGLVDTAAETGSTYFLDLSAVGTHAASAHIDWERRVTVWAQTRGFQVTATEFGGDRTFHARISRAAPITQGEEQELRAEFPEIVLV